MSAKTTAQSVPEAAAARQHNPLPSVQRQPERRRFNLQISRLVGNQAMACALQAQLKVGRPGDPFEREADRTADQVMAGGIAAKMDAGQEAPTLQRKCKACQEQEAEGSPGLQMKGAKAPQIQRACANCEEELQRQPIEEEEEGVQAKPAADQAPSLILRQADAESEEESLQAKPAPGQAPVAGPAVQSGIQNLKQGGGQPLPPGVRTFMEPRFGADFSQVRVHTDQAAARLSHNLQARAFTVGSNVFFGAGEFQPGTASGLRLVAHELTHTIQQGEEAVRRAPSPAQEEVEEEETPPASPSKVPGQATGVPGGVLFGDQPEFSAGPRFLRASQIRSFKAVLSPRLGGDEKKARSSRLKSLGKDAGVRRQLKGDPAFFPRDILRVKVFSKETGKAIAADEVQWTPPQQLELIDTLIDARFRVKDGAQAGRASLLATFPKDSKPESLSLRIEELPQEPVLEKAFHCNENEEKMAVAALQRGAEVASIARGKLQSQPASQLVRSNLLRFFFPLEHEQYRKAAAKAQKTGAAQPKMSDFEIHPLAIENTIERVSDTLGFIANRMILSAQIDCAPGLECDKNTGAFVQTGDNRVFLCHSWLAGTIAFTWTGSGDEARAYALLHEFAHLTGATVRILEGKEEKEPYTFRGTSWKKVQHKDALEAADAYAAFAWNVMQGSS